MSRISRPLSLFLLFSVCKVVCADVPASGPAPDAATVPAASVTDATSSTPPAPAAATTPPPAPTPAARPAYSYVRYDESYTFLKDPAQRTDMFDPIKYIPFGPDADWYASFGGQIRDRYEFFNHNTFGAGPQDHDGYNLVRVLANAEVHLGPNLRFFAQGISALEEGREGGPRPTDIDQVNLHQGFGELTLPVGPAESIMVRAGRQNLLFGAQRLIGPLDWVNVRRTFDAVRITFNSPGNALDVFYSRPIQPAKYNFDSDISGTDLTGIYDTWKLPGPFAASAIQLETYGLYVDRRNTLFPTEGTSNEGRYTLGGRISGNPKPFDFDVEGDYQFGRFKGENISAFSLASLLGCTFAELPFTPHPYLGFDIASGDSRAHDGRLETFDQLFPTAHIYFGYINVIGRENIIDLHPGFDLCLLKDRGFAKKLTLTTEYHEFWRESDQDAVYSATGGVLRASTTNRATLIGGELDVLLNWQIDRHANFYTGYSHFFPGTFIRETGAHEPIDFLYAAVTYTF